MLTIKKEMHHLIKQQRARKKGKVAEWVHSEINTVMLTVDEHKKVHTAHGNKQATIFKRELYQNLIGNLQIWNDQENFFCQTEMKAIRDVYSYATMGSLRKEFKPDQDTMKLYELCCVKYIEHYQNEQSDDAA